MNMDRLVIDSSPLNYAVNEELLRGGTKYAQLYQASAQSWITVVNETTLEYLQLFSEYHKRQGGGSRNIGEATTLAYAELHNITAMVDDKVGRNHGKERGVRVTGTLELICQGIRERALELHEAAARHRPTSRS